MKSDKKWKKAFHHLDISDEEKKKLYDRYEKELKEAKITKKENEDDFPYGSIWIGL
jgi:DnaJ-class molecular chaperone